MISSSIPCTGMECRKAPRFLDSLKIKCFKRREFSNLQRSYIIPAVFNVWTREQRSLLHEVKGTQICVASDMRVDSPGHSGLLGSGSSLDTDRNIILDTQVIKVIGTLVSDVLASRTATRIFHKLFLNSGHYILSIKFFIQTKMMNNLKIPGEITASLISESATKLTDRY